MSPDGTHRRPPQTAEALERQARARCRRASLPTFLAVLTAPLAVAFLFTLPLALFQMWFAASAFRSLRRIEPRGATHTLGIAAAIAGALVVESVLTLQPALLAGDAVNVAVLGWAWLEVDRARAKAREAWGVREVAVLERAAARDRRHSPLELAARLRADAEDDLAYLDAAVADPDTAGDSEPDGRDTGRGVQ